MWKKSSNMFWKNTLSSKQVFKKLISVKKLLNVFSSLENSFSFLKTVPEYVTSLGSTLIILFEN